MKRKNKILQIFGFIMMLILVWSLYSFMGVGSSNYVEEDYSVFVQEIKDGDINNATIGDSQITYHKYDDESKTYYTEKLDWDNLIDVMIEHEVYFTYKSEDTNPGLALLINMLPLIFWGGIIVLFLLPMIRGMGGQSGQGGVGGGIMSVGKSKAKMNIEKNTGITFKDVAGQDEAKESVEEIIDILHNPEKYKKIGAKIPKGALLVGPPGTGKTLLAKAVAGEAQVPFFYLSGSDFVEMFVGVGASRVRDLFAEAKRNAPCIVFIDEIDAIGKKRDSGRTGGGNDEREQTLNQLLVEMDGFDENEKPVILLAATNQPNTLDKALLRPGRFDRRIIVDVPDLKGRLETLIVHSKNVALDESVDLDAIALATSGCVGSDLANMINEAAIIAVRRNSSAVSQADLMEAIEVVIAGKEKKDRLMSDKEKHIVSYHEVGHAVAAALSSNSMPVHKITIVPRTAGSLGYTMQIPEEEKFLNSKEDIITEVRTLLAGRCAEEIFCNIATTGASNDIERATGIVKRSITKYGLSEKFGMVCLESSDGSYLGNGSMLDCSPETATLIDEEIRHIIKEEHDTIYGMLEQHKDMIEEIAAYLYEKENISGEEFMQIFRKYVKKDANSKDNFSSIYKSQTAMKRPEKKDDAKQDNKKNVPAQEKVEKLAEPKKKEEEKKPEPKLNLNNILPKKTEEKPEPIETEEEPPEMPEMSDIPEMPDDFGDDMPELDEGDIEEPEAPDFDDFDDENPKAAEKKEEPAEKKQAPEQKTSANPLKIDNLIKKPSLPPKEVEQKPQEEKNFEQRKPKKVESLGSNPQQGPNNNQKKKNNKPKNNKPQSSGGGDDMSKLLSGISNGTITKNKNNQNQQQNQNKPKKGLYSSAAPAENQKKEDTSSKKDKPNSDDISEDDY